jgi:hypothetical protein
MLILIESQREWSRLWTTLRNWHIAAEYLQSNNDKIDSEEDYKRLFFRYFLNNEK